jgi:pimeloyl-ACP methyl ester carboxylesterase
MSTLPTLIYTHGGWHGPEYWNPVISILARKGFRSIAPHLLFGGTDKPITSLEPVIEQIKGLVADETSKGNNVVIINHSFGSFPGCSAIKGFTATDSSNLSGQNSGKVLGVLTVAGFFPETEVSFSAVAAAAQNASSASDSAAAGQLPFAATEEGWLEFTGDPIHAFYSDLPNDEAQKWATELEKLSRFAVGAHEHVYAGWKDVPVWYLFCKADTMMALSQQEAYVKKARDGGGNVTTREVDAGHSPMLSKPDEVAQFVQDAVASFTH